MIWIDGTNFQKKEANMQNFKQIPHILKIISYSVTIMVIKLTSIDAIRCIGTHNKWVKAYVLPILYELYFIGVITNIKKIIDGKI